MMRPLRDPVPRAHTEGEVCHGHCEQRYLRQRGQLKHSPTRVNTRGLPAMALSLHGHQKHKLLSLGSDEKSGARTHLLHTL